MINLPLPDYLPLHDPDLEKDNENVLPKEPSQGGEHIIQLCRNIVERHAALEIDGTIMDAWTAAAVVTLADNLSPKQRAKFIAMRTPVRMGTTAQTVVFGRGSKRTLETVSHG